MEPFDTFRAQLPGWTLAITDLDGVMGYCDLDRQTIWVDVNLTDRQRRSTFMHEIIHALRGDADDNPASEAATAIETARRLIPPPALRGAFAAACHPEDIADALEVDLDVLRTRLRNLDADERSLLRRLLTAGIPADPAGTNCTLGRWWRHHGQPDPLPCPCCAPATRPATTPPAIEAPRHTLGLAARVRD